ncbi:hypothetical protein DFH07DRAFT_742106 [Mycena maculata]|uniref:L domain-like protein n=1 Tax=Mycena maculata TaxID=230809 RepID=A0AAD7J623_9AGAR|nr:hypothetical protein DFH07DRAFT_742106 [Mycena maculata]
MSRIPQPSRGTPRKPAAPPAQPSASSSTPRLRTKSTVARATTPSKSPLKQYADSDFGPDKKSTLAASAQPPVSGGTPRLRTKSAVSRPKTPSKPSSKPYTESDFGPDKKSVPEMPQLSIKEAIALKRAEAKKAQQTTGPLDNFAGLEDAIPNAAPPEDDILGRPPLRETIERAKSTGSINLSTRSLQCIPSALFDLHLGITPESLKSVPEEPPLPPAPETRQKRAVPAWFEIQDLEVLKAWGNEIVEIQPEISLFGSLKSIDLHKNKIVSLPDQFADLVALTTLDLSHNALTSLPPNLFSLPALSNLNVANNALTSLPFSAPFSSPTVRAQTTARGLFAAEIPRASTPLPKLVILDACNNKLTGGAIDLAIPDSLITLDLSGNPLESDGHEAEACSKLFVALATRLRKLKVLRCAKADISDRIFEGLPSGDAFPSVSVFDFGETKITRNGATVGLKGLSQALDFEITNEDPPGGIARVIVGKKIVREAWEVEAERRSKSRAGKAADIGEDWETAPSVPARALQQKPKTPVVKEQWELDAEQGLLTEGGKRRARAAAAAASAAGDSGLGLGAPPRKPSPTPKTSSLAEYYTPRSETLALPASTAPPKAAGHARATSLASTSLVKFPPPRATDVTLPTATMPLALIAAQPFAQTLKVLLLKNRRMDRSFTLPIPSTGAPLLPRLEELSLEGCNLGDTVAVSTASAEQTPFGSGPSETRSILPLLSQLFPGLRTLDMAYNALTSTSLTTAVLSDLILSPAVDDAPGRRGLKQLQLRGNRITDLDGFQGVALLFKGNREVPEWGLEELDLRDNEIGRLPAELGLLPLDVFLVDGNVFRVPARRVWEREGTRGLLSWLRGRIE